MTLKNNPQILDQMSLEVNIRSRTDSYFVGKVKSITSVNATGVFDVLPMHANFITLIKDYVVLDKGRDSEKKIDFKSAVLSVISGKVDIHVGI